MVVPLTVGLVLVGAIAAWRAWLAGRAPGSRAAAAAQIDAALSTTGAPPATCAPAMVREWARGRACTWCGGAVRESRLSGRHIALLDPGGVTREWVDVDTHLLPLALATSLPVCWNCHLAALFRRTHPELVTDREDAAIRVQRGE
ncbi:MAG TPA: hypothetical protein VM032_19530 [Vicinamibacterales bacterium]|nr:hypothetical protein [Vicinamibacterales bacterium]